MFVSYVYSCSCTRSWTCLDRTTLPPLTCGWTCPRSRSPLPVASSSSAGRGRTSANQGREMLAPPGLVLCFGCSRTVSDLWEINERLMIDSKFNAELRIWIRSDPKLFTYQDFDLDPNWPEKTDPDPLWPDKQDSDPKLSSRMRLDRIVTQWKRHNSRHNGLNLYH